MYLRGPSGRREMRRKKNGNGNSSQELKRSALANTRQEMNAQQTRSECEERKIHINSVSFLCQCVFISTKCTYLVDESYDDVARHNVTKKRHICFPPLAIRVWVCVFRLFFYSFFSRFIEEIYTQQWQHNTIFRSSLLRIWMFSFIFHSGYHGSIIFAHEKTTIISFQFLCQLCDKFIKRFVYLALELVERFEWKNEQQSRERKWWFILVHFIHQQWNVCAHSQWMSAQCPSQWLVIIIVVDFIESTKSFFFSNSPIDCLAIH